MLKDKVPPHNEEAEIATLGALLLASEAYNDVVKIVKPNDFYKNSHRLIFESIIFLRESGKEVDIITLADSLISLNKLEQAGGYGYLSNLTSSVPSTVNVEYYAQIVKDCALKRQVIKLANELIADGYEDNIGGDNLVGEAERRVFELARERQTSDYRNANEIIPKVVERIQKLYKSKEAITGVPTGFRKLDEMTTGFHGGELIIIAARPSVGKTTFALNVATHIAIKKKIPVGFFSLEMPDMDLYDRIVASEARLDSNKVRSGLLRPGDLRSIQEAVSTIWNSPLYTDDTPSIKLMDLRAQARRMKQKDKIEILFIDYISLISHENKALPRHEQVADFSRSLKALSRELDIPVVVLSQLTRDTEGKSPTLANLRESGSLEQDADVVLFLHRERLAERSAEEGPPANIPTELIIGKQRKGPIGTIKLSFLPQFTRFDGYEEHEN